MKQLVIFIVLRINVREYDVDALSQFDVEPEHTNGIPITFGQRSLAARSLRSSNTVCSAENLYQPVCNSDCKKLFKCNGNIIPYGEMICPQHARYCVNNQCTPKKGSNPNCDKVTGDENIFNFVCTKENEFFPDPKISSQYFNCDNERTVKSYTCAAGYIYNTYSKNCIKSTSTKKIPMINCHKKNGLYVPYPADPNIYGLCTIDNKSCVKIIMYKCESPELSMVESSQICEFQCRREGGVLDSTEANCSRYYFCSINNGSYEMIIYDCPKGYVYDEKKQSCVLSDTCIV